MPIIKVVHENNIGNGLFIAGGKLHADPSYGPSTLALTGSPLGPAAPTLGVTVNGQTATLDLTPLIQAGETNTTLTYDPTAKALTYTNEDGVAFVIDLSALAMDIFVNGASYNASTMVLTLTDNEGTTPDIQVNLAELKKVATAVSQSINWSGTGEDSNPLIASINLDPLAGNLLKVTASGVKVDPADITVTTDYGIDGNGQPGNPINFNADELEAHWEDTGNPEVYIVVSSPYRPAGTRVTTQQLAQEFWTYFIENEVANDIAAALAATLTVDVQDLAGNHLFTAAA